jgi:hypothetical protein
MRRRTWFQRIGLQGLRHRNDARDLKVRHLGPSVRPLTGVCRCGMAFTAYWSHRQTIQHQLWVRLRKREARERQQD